jgi:glycogen operon protein
MLVAGDEFGRTQHGNNNAYCQDSEISWVDWTAAQQPRAQQLADFVARVIAIRKEFVAACASRFPHGREQTMAGIPDIAWFDEGGQPMTPEAWQNAERRSFAVRTSGQDADGAARVLLLLLNASDTDIDFTLPGPSFHWQLRADSADPQATERNVQDKVRVGAHGTVVLGARVAKRDTAPAG